MGAADGAGGCAAATIASTGGTPGSSPRAALLVPFAQGRMGLGERIEELVGGSQHIAVEPAEVGALGAQAQITLDAALHLRALRRTQIEAAPLARPRRRRGRPWCAARPDCTCSRPFRSVCREAGKHLGAEVRARQQVVRLWRAGRAPSREDAAWPVRPSWCQSSYRTYTTTCDKISTEKRCGESAKVLLGWDLSDYVGVAGSGGAPGPPRPAAAADSRTPGRCQQGYELVIANHGPPGPFFSERHGPVWHCDARPLNCRKRRSCSQESAAHFRQPRTSGIGRALGTA